MSTRLGPALAALLLLACTVHCARGQTVVRGDTVQKVDARDPSIMLVEGHAGYVAGVLGADKPMLRAVFVGAWAEKTRGRFCTQVKSEKDGSFSLMIPKGCFTANETIFLTSGGYETCTTVNYRPGSRVEVELYGQPGPVCE
ncbi:hypothetical protein ABI59_13415 [Acidobacteria bacterium Mor1]|nr:hypothetical protein ABI59_13415 [Acidobacteria bacterium Mor1]